MILEAFRNCLVEVVMLLVRRVELVKAAFVILEWNIFLAAEIDNGWWLRMLLSPIVVDKRRRNRQCDFLLMRRGTVALDHRDRRFGPLHFRVVHLRLVAPFLQLRPRTPEYRRHIQNMLNRLRLHHIRRKTREVLAPLHRRNDADAVRNVLRLRHHAIVDAEILRVRVARGEE